VRALSTRRQSDADGDNMVTPRKTACARTMAKHVLKCNAYVPDVDNGKHRALGALDARRG